ncbi:hypothetical protein ACUOA8_33105, partial [Escherichia sp. SS-MK2]
MTASEVGNPDAQIACVYAWLAQLFSRELDDEQLTQI